MARVIATKAVVDWVNAHPTLSGTGNPLDQGAFRSQVRSPSRGAYLELYRIDGADSLTAEEPIDQARIAGIIYASTHEAGEAAAVGYANALAALSGTPTPMGEVTCLLVDEITGPQFLDDQAGATGEQFAWQVDATFYLR